MMGKDSSEVSNTIHLKKLTGLKGGDFPFLVPASQMYVFFSTFSNSASSLCVCCSLDNILRIHSSKPVVLKSKLGLVTLSAC